MAVPSDGTCDLTTDLDPDLEWEVASLADLEILETDATDCSTLGIFQTSDIDLDGLASPIDNWYGTFNGNGFRLTDSNPGSAPTLDPEPSLFDYPSGVIDIINVIRLGDVSDGFGVGGMIGRTSFEVSITNSYTTGNTSGNDFVGGLIGLADGDVTITNSYTTGDTTGDSDVGGLIGYARGDMTITNTYTTGDTTGDILVGGLIGYARGDMTITNSYTTGDTTGDVYVGGLIGLALSTESTITDSYTTGDTTGDGYVGGLIGRNQMGVVEITNVYTTGNTTAVISDSGAFIGFNGGSREFTSIFCLDSNPACVPDIGASPASAVELQSESFLTGWDFSSVWCLRSTLNDGFPVLRSITFGPGDTNNCRSARASRRDVTFDPAGGSCADHTSTWTVRFRGSYTLPAATDCTRDGYVFLGWTRDPALTAPENLLTSRVARSGTLTAVWGQLPAAPTKVDVLANFLCRQNCNSAFVIWPTSSNPSDTAVITLDGSDTTCSTSGETSGLMWCWITGLASGSTHTTSVAWRNQHGPSPATSAVFDLR